jgi:hypothetical protein
MWSTGKVSVENLALDASGVTWEGSRFGTVVFCQGWEAAQHPWFDWVPFRSARGTIVSLETDLGGERRVVNNGAWVLPRHDGVIRAGATYDMRFDPGKAKIVPPVDISQLEQKLTVALAVPFTILAAQSAVRPIIDRQRVLIGRHPGRQGGHAGQWVGAGTVEMDGIVFDTITYHIDTHRGCRQTAQRGRSPPLERMKPSAIVE